MLEHTQCLLHWALTLGPCESSGMYVYMLSASCLLWEQPWPMDHSWDTLGAYLLCWPQKFHLKKWLSVRLPAMGSLLSLCVYRSVCTCAHHGYLQRQSKGFLNSQLSHTHFLTRLYVLLDLVYSMHLHAYGPCIFVFVYVMWRFRQSPMTLYVRDSAWLVKVSNLQSILVEH